MRVHVFGGVLAYDYLLAGWLRASGVDAHYFFNIKLVEADYPWWEDRSFDRNHMPEWCHYYHFRLPYLYRGPLPREGRRFVRDFNAGADVALVVGEGLFLAQHYTHPYVLWSCGFDIESAVPAPVSIRGAISKIMGGPEPVRLQRRLNRRHVREQLQNASLIMTVMDFQIPTYLAWTGVTTPAVSVPMPYDCTRYEPVPVPDLAERYADSGCVFFLPTRHSYGSRSTNDKGADKVIRAFASVVRTLPVSARLVLVEKGERLGESREAVRELGLEPWVDWIPELRKDELKRWYSLPGVVVLDQFPNETTIDPALHAALRRRGGRGSIFAEAMCMGCPLISNVGVEWIEEHRPPMVWNACFEDEIAAAMRAAAARSREDRIAGGHANRRWAEEEIHWPRVMKRYIELLEQAARGEIRR
ncbi:MAG TPA: glycosyltransferase [Gemmatimonadales bacterium]|nr:glycosyltransferase [Gemmatimonadales bacterium]